MKYIKTYEQNLNEPKIGDYVVCSEKSELGKGYDRIEKQVYKFIENNIGQVIESNYENVFNSEGRYAIIYKDIPKKLESYFLAGKYFLLEYKGCRLMKLEEIKFWSEDKDVCQTYLDTHKEVKKFNL